MAMTRREARERVFELLYELEIKGISADELLASLPVPPGEWVERFVRGVADDQERLDSVIRSHLRHDWDLDRLAITDRLALRAGVWELEHGDAPRPVVLSEAVELAKRYGGDESGRFVNGVLAAVSPGHQ